MIPVELENLSEKCFRELAELTHKLTGISVSSGRKSMIQGRVRRRLVQLGLTSYEAYLAKVLNDPAERPHFIDLVTTNETYFFRTPRIWTYLENEFLPDWIKKNPNKTFTAWSAAASTGDESCSLGVLLQAFKDSHPSFTYSILGTDISGEMVERCKNGMYRDRSIENFKQTRPNWFSRYMTQVPGGPKEDFKVSAEIARHQNFRQHNLFQPLLGKEEFELILCRNVLIYFTPDDQEKVLKLLEPRLAKNGVLIIGESESLSYIKTDFVAEAPLIYRRQSESETKRGVA